jgi:hypothetical protein
MRHSPKLCSVHIYRRQYREEYAYTCENNRGCGSNKDNTRTTQISKARLDFPLISKGVMNRNTSTSILHDEMLFTQTIVKLK